MTHVVIREYLDGIGHDCSRRGICSCGQSLARSGGDGPWQAVTGYGSAAQSRPWALGAGCASPANPWPQDNKPIEALLRVVVPAADDATVSRWAREARAARPDWNAGDVARRLNAPATPGHQSTTAQVLSTGVDGGFCPSGFDAWL